jgi:D-alanyl-D-alanine carboxypeptidase
LRRAAALLAVMLAAPSLARAHYADIVIDAETGEVLHQDGADLHNYPASLTKMMTLYLTFEALHKGRLKLDQQIPVSAHASAQAPTKLGLRPAQTIRVETCILGLVTKSANDGAVTLAEALGGGSELRFAGMMTAKARQLGMNSTHFHNASGLPDPEQSTTARDIAVLARALIYDFPQYYPYFSRREFSYNGERIANHNHLMSRYDGMDGLKTGYIRAVGFNLAASAVRDGRRLIAVVLGGQSPVQRDNRVAELLDEGFAHHTHGGPVIARRSPEDARAVTVAQAVHPAEPPLPQGKSDDEAMGDDNEPAEGPVPQPAMPPGATLAVATVPANLPVRPPGQWGIQIGAFADRGAGQRAMEAIMTRFPQILGAAQPVMVAAESRTLFRARLMGLDENAARDACAKLTVAGQTCLTVPPQTR